MTKPIKYEDWDYVVHTSAMISLHDGYKEGTVNTRDGIVCVYAEPACKGGLTHLQFICNGKCYCRIYRKYLSNRTIVTKARRFAREIVEAGR